MDEPKLYDHSHPFQERDNNLVWKFMSPRLSEIEMGQNILDVGCGTGEFTKIAIEPWAAKNRGSHIVAVDINPKMISYASEHYSHDRIHYEVLNIAGDVREFKTKHGNFSKILSFHCFHWLEDMSAGLKNVRYLMSSVGECLLSFAVAAPLFQANREIGKMEKWKDYTKDWKRFVPETHDKADPASYIEGIAVNAGLQPKTCEVLNMAWVYNNSREALADVITPILPFLPRIPHHLKEDFLNDYMNLVENHRIKSGPNEYQIWYKLLVMHAVAKI